MIEAALSPTYRRTIDQQQELGDMADVASGLQQQMKELKEYVNDALGLGQGSLEEMVMRRIDKFEVRQRETNRATFDQVELISNRISSKIEGVEEKQKRWYEMQVATEENFEHIKHIIKNTEATLHVETYSKTKYLNEKVADLQKQISKVSDQLANFKNEQTEKFKVMDSHHSLLKKYDLQIVQIKQATADMNTKLDEFMEDDAYLSMKEHYSEVQRQYLVVMEALEADVRPAIKELQQKGEKIEG